MSDHKADAKAAFTGLIVGAIVLFALMYSIVRMTNAKFASHAVPAASP